MINDNSQRATLANMILQHYLLTNQNVHQHYRQPGQLPSSMMMSNYHETLLEMKRTEHLFNSSLMASLANNANVTNQYHSSPSFYGNVLLLLLLFRLYH